jgi:uncharacterized Zn finger protein
MTANKIRFDVKALQDLAGEKVFARGDAYFRSGQVSLLSVDPQRVLAEVAGSEDYRTLVTGRGSRIGGECSCRAFEDRGFCKHMVAAALAANASGDAAEETGALSRIRDHLKAQGIDALVGMILGLAEQDPALFRRLDLASAARRGDDRAVETRLRRTIDSATRTKGHLDYREVSGWAAGVDEALDGLADLVPAGQAALAFRLAEHAIERIVEAADGIDDSDGHWMGLLHRAGEIHLAAARALRPEPVQLARSLFTREMESDHDIFDDASVHYADVLGDAGLAEYRRLAAEAWEKLPTRIGKVHGEPETGGDAVRLMGILDTFAARDGDVETRIALRAKNLTSRWSYLQLAEFCLEHGRDEEALRHAEEGLWMFEDDPAHDERLTLLAARLLSSAGRSTEAAAHLWQAFEKAPSLNLFARLRDLGGDAARERALAVLETRAAKRERVGWSSPADLLIRILMQEKMFDAAWAALRRHGASKGLQESLARASELTHPKEALETYAERVGHLVEGGGNHAYEEAAQFIARMAGLRDADEQAAYVAGLKARYGRRRNFMKLLP